MPITQGRMIAVLDAANALIENYTELKKRVREHRRTLADDIREGRRVDILDEFDGMIGIIDSLSPDGEQGKIIGIETGHFNARKKRNDRTRDHLRYIRARDSQPEAPIEIRLEPAIIELEDLHSRIHAKWRETIGYIPTIRARTIANLIAEAYGEKSEARQAALIDELVQEGILITTRIGGEYLVRNPDYKPDLETTSIEPEAPSPEQGSPLSADYDPETQGGLLPNRLIGLKKRDP